MLREIRWKSERNGDPENLVIRDMVGILIVIGQCFYFQSNLPSKKKIFQVNKLYQDFESIILK